MLIKQLEIMQLMVLWLLAFLFVSCNEGKQTQQKLSKVQTILEELKGRQVLIPDSVAFIYRDSLYHKNILNDKHKKLTVVSHIHGDCHVCVDALKKWESDFMPLIDTSRIAFHFYIYTEKPYSFRIGLYPQIQLDYPLILDTANYFLRHNKLDIYDERFRSFLLDESKDIILAGSPIHNPKMKVLFVREINERLKNN